MVASAAAFRDDGSTVGGALDPIKLARSSYEAELQALIDVLMSWPTAANNMTVSILIDLDGFSIELCTDQLDRDARKAKVLSLLIELFDARTDEEVSLFQLGQWLQPRIPAEELIAVLEELDGDGYIMYRAETAHRI